MTATINPLSDVMGAEATGIDLRTPPDDRTLSTLTDALHRHVVLCIRDQSLEPDAFVKAARLFGAPVRQVNKYLNFPDQPEIGMLSSDDRDVVGTGKRVIRGTTWHTDHSFTAQPPKATILYALVVPESGGETSFCNMRAAYDALPEQTKRRLDGLKAVHTYQSSRSPRKMMKLTEDEKEALPEVVHPLVRTHPATGAKALYMSTTRLERIAGLERAESDALIDELLTHATKPEFQYDHVWQAGDMVIWDNRCSMHHANANYPLDAKRLLHRIILEGEIPV
ncbi:MAG: TauD/TfdA family dioxygenase [Alphaproteobacteria bacterium]|nr:TauD/TfdA family dioxygenase [Alphaproteobacteria bacterium]